RLLFVPRRYWRHRPVSEDRHERDSVFHHFTLQCCRQTLGSLVKLSICHLTSYINGRSFRHTLTRSSGSRPKKKRRSVVITHESLIQSDHGGDEFSSRA